MKKENATINKSSRTAELQDKDRKYVWHPFTQQQDWVKDDFLVIERAEGVHLYDTEGRKYLDGVSSLWCNVHGHRVPEIDDAVRAQMDKVSHSTFLGLSNVPAIELAEKLVQITPPGLDRVFYSDSGSEAVEIALKMAFQYWQLTGKPNKKKFVKLTNSYHGDTLGSVSVGGIDLFHQIFKPLLFDSFSAPSPYVYRWPTGSDYYKVKDEALAALEKVLAEHHEEIAAFVMEPLMQGAAGMINQPDGYIAEARRLTRKYNVLLIFDEVATGFGRTGNMFASDQESVSPDIMAVAKGLTGGYLPLAATLTSEQIYEAFLGEYAEMKAFFHGHTFTANPLSCAAALASLELFEKNRILDGLGNKIHYLANRLQKFYALPAVGQVRLAGMMGGIELVRDRDTKEMYPAERKIAYRVCERAREKGAVLRPIGHVMILMPPLAMTRDHLEELLDIISEAIIEETA